MCGTVPVRLGVNLGPVRLVKDLNGQMNIIGDGINVAQRVMSFSRPGPAAGVALLLRSGVVPVARLHQSVPPRRLAHRQARARARGVFGGRRHADGAARGADGIEVLGARQRPRLARRPGPLGLRRTSLAAASALFVLLIGVGIAARAVIGRASACREARGGRAQSRTGIAPKVASAPAQAAHPRSRRPRRRRSWRRSRRRWRKRRRRRKREEGRSQARCSRRRSR